MELTIITIINIKEGIKEDIKGNNDLPPQATPGYIPPAYPETSQQQGSYGGGYSSQQQNGYNPQQQQQQQLGTYNSEEFSRPEGPPRHILKVIRL